MFFEDYFDITGGPSEIPVCCPFPHSTANGLPYYETRPSASVNTKAYFIVWLVVKA